MKLVLLFLLALMTTQFAAAQTSDSDEATKRLYALFDDEWEYNLKENPTFATYLGDKRYNDRWSDLSLAAIERRHRRKQETLEKLKSIDRSKLSVADQLNYDLFRKKLEQDIERYQFKTFLIPLDQQGGIQTEDELAQFINFQTVKDYEDWIRRLNAFPVLMDQTIELMREGRRQNLMLPKIVMQRVPAQIDKQITANAEDNSFYAPFKNFSGDISEADRARLRAAAKEAIDAKIVPAYRKLKEFFVKEYLPASYDGAGVWQRASGDKFYEFLARDYTTTALTPKEIHEKGLAEVKRIRAEMERIKEKVGFKGTLQEFFTFLRTDPQFFYKTPEELLQAYRAVSKRIDPEVARVFRTMPRMPYGVIPIPDKIAPDTTTAYYNRPAADGSRPGYYYVNLYKPETRPKWEMMALSIHEAVPGHHLQIALQQELGEVPNFRKYGGYTAFTEGWGLYSESLGEEMGLYEDPYDKFGQLTYEMWRAVRLVVDTGIHYFKWDRQKAIDYFKENAAKTDQDIVNEIDRYISTPGQALAYKIGELKIKELRARAKNELGEKFDIKDFHDVVLLSGAVPLDILERNVNEYIAKKKGQTLKSKTNVIQLTPKGFITLPKTYWAFMDYDMMDAWGGIIEPLNGKGLQIRYSDGIVVSVFEQADNKNIKWMNELKNGKENIIYALIEDGAQKHVAAKIDGANFSAKIAEESDIDKFLEIIKNYRSGRCSDCLNSSFTKRMRKNFERESN